ncbi:MAG: high frequency lysogenization protein HflD [Xanthomonadales bacterium]|nr:high frequency lysogenization protein HflD [Xanthomonadales bacterium]
MKHRTLALAGVFQATELVRQAACHGTWSGFAATSCLDSLFRLEADRVEDVYGGSGKLRLGVETMLSVLQGEQRHMDALRYAVGLLQIERKFKRQPDTQRTVQEGLERISSLGKNLEPHEREDFQAQQISELYCSSISKIDPRIVVNGRPQYLQVPRTVDWVRTLLLAGLRSAFLWDQLGGGRLELIFGRKKICREAESILLDG